MTDGMTRAVRDDLAKLAYALAKGLPKQDAKALIEMFGRERDLIDPWALFVRGKDLARREREKGRAA